MVDVEKLRIEVKKLERHSALYKMLKEELTALGYWRIKPRGNPRAGYEAQQREK